MSSTGVKSENFDVTDSRTKTLNFEEKLKQEQNEKEQLMIMQTKEKRRLLGMGYKLKFIVAKERA